MTLHYTDMETDGRLNPSVDAPDVRINTMAHSTASISPRAKGTQAAAKVITKDSRIIGFDGSNNIGLFGFDDAGNMVVKIAKPGHDANTATNDQLIFNSQQDTFKIANTVTGSLAPSFSSVTQGAGGPVTYTNYSTNTLTMAHGLTFTPSIVAYIFDPNISKYVPVSSGSLITTSTPNPQIIYNNLPSVIGIATYTWEISVDATNVTVRGVIRGGQVQSSTMPAYTFGSATFKVFCQQETAN